MRKNNPIVIPRNHKIEEALSKAENGNIEFTKKILSILINPYSDQKEIIDFQLPNTHIGKKYKTFCGT